MTCYIYRRRCQISYKIYHVWYRSKWLFIYIIASIIIIIIIYYHHPFKHHPLFSFLSSFFLFFFFIFYFRFFPFYFNSFKSSKIAINFKQSLSYGTNQVYLITTSVALFYYTPFFSPLVKNTQYLFFPSLLLHLVLFLFFTFFFTLSTLIFF